jgi:hypothetical protein
MAWLDARAARNLRRITPTAAVVYKPCMSEFGRIGAETGIPDWGTKAMKPRPGHPGTFWPRCFHKTVLLAKAGRLSAQQFPETGSYFFV